MGLKKRRMFMGMSLLALVVAVVGIWVATASSDDGDDPASWSAQEVEALVKRADQARSVDCKSIDATPELRRWRCRVVTKTGSIGTLTVRVDREGNVSSRGRGVAGVAVTAGE